MDKSEFVENYVTADLFIGAAITCITGKYPSQYIITDERRGSNAKVMLRWKSIPSDVKVKLDRRELRVCPFKFKPVFLRLKKNVLSAADKARGVENVNKTTSH